MARRMLLAYFVVVTAVCGSPGWTCLRSPHFEVYSDAGAHVSRRVLQQFERVRQVAAPRSSRPATVLVFARDADFHSYRAGSASGFYLGASDRDFIALSASASDAGRVVLHEYTHLLLFHNSAVLPLWLEEGLAEFYSTLRFDATKVRVGEPVRTHLTQLTAGDWLTARELRSVSKTSRTYNENARSGMFYAQSWALVHMLNLAPGWRSGLEELVAALGRGEPQEAAFQSAYRRSMGQALDELRLYLKGPMVGIALDAAVDPGVEAVLEPATDAEVAELRADLYTLAGRPREAEEILRKLVKAHPDGAESYGALAAIALRERRFDEARDQFRKAIDLDGKNGRMLFEYAMLLRDTGAPPQEVTAWLNRAVTASPALGEAHFLLGTRAADGGHYQEAVEHLRRATALGARRSYYWEALAWACYRLGDAAGSSDAAHRARNAAVTEQEIGSAEAALLLTVPGVPVPARKAPVNTPSSWNNPKGDARVEGVLTMVECGQTARLHIGDLVLEVLDPGRVVLEGTREVQAELRCGAQRMRVAVEYKSGSREVTRIEFR